MSASGGPLPYLTGDLRRAFDAWLDDAVERHRAGLTFPEIRKGVRALSALWVERRGGGDLGARSVAGRGKRAAIATYYAPLHFLVVHHALRAIAPEGVRGTSRVIDVGVGTGASGAAVALAAAAPVPIVGVDRSGWALSEARRTWRAFGLRGRGLRGRLPGALPPLRHRDLVLLGWVANEIEGDERNTLRGALEEALRRGARLLVLEPLAGRRASWWKEWRRALAPSGVRETELAFGIERPGWVRDLDRASGLDHARIGACLLYRAPGPTDQISAA